MGEIDLVLLSMAHARTLEQFERVNREYFAARVGDRGDGYFEHFDDRLEALVEENRRGVSLLFVVVDGVGDIVGRVNITDIDQSELTEVGFRVAESAQGRGVASTALAAALDVARERGVRSVQARVAEDNVASRRVVERQGFQAIGSTAAPDGSDATFVSYRLDLEG